VGSSERGRNENPWKEGSEESSVSEEQYQERFWRRRLDGIGLDTVNKVFLAIEFKRTQDARSNYVERAAAAAQDQYKSLLAGLQAVGRVNGWRAQQIVFVGDYLRDAAGSRSLVFDLRICDFVSVEFVVT
jgi:hypothetical protein